MSWMAFRGARHTRWRLRARCAGLEAEAARKDVAMSRLESRLGAKEDEVQMLREELEALQLQK